MLATELIRQSAIIKKNYIGKKLGLQKALDFLIVERTKLKNRIGGEMSESQSREQCENIAILRHEIQSLKWSIKRL